MTSFTKIISIFLVFVSFFACEEAPKNNTPTDKPVDAGASRVDTNAELTAISDMVHNFYKWYDVFSADEKRNINYLDSKGKVTKLDNAKVAAYHAELMKSGFLSQTYIDNDMAHLKTYEAIWQKDKEDINEGPLSGADYDRVFCGQDWDITALTTGAVKVDGLGTNQVKASIESARLELVKENGKWLIAKISCEP